MLHFVTSVEIILVKTNEIMLMANDNITKKTGLQIRDHCLFACKG